MPGNWHDAAKRKRREAQLKKTFGREYRPPKFRNAARLRRRVAA